MYMFTHTIDMYGHVPPCTKCGALFNKPCISKQNKKVSYLHIARQRQIIKDNHETPVTKHEVKVIKPKPAVTKPTVIIDTSDCFVEVEGYHVKAKTVRYDYVKHMTEKAILFSRYGYSFWIPKSVVIATNLEILDIIIPLSWKVKAVD